MQDFQTLLNAATAGDISATKQLEVATAAEQKKDAMNASAGRGNTMGLASAAQRELDMRTLNPFELTVKYGPTATRDLADANNAGLATDLSFRTGFGEVAKDTTIDVAGGLAQSIGGIGAAGLGMLDADAGTGAAQALTDLNEWGQAQQSAPLQARRAANAITGALRTRDNTQQFEADKKAGDSDLMAGLKRVGRDAVDAVANATDDDMVLASGVSNAAGSLLAAGPLTKVIKGGTAVAGLAKIGEKVATPLAIGAMEGGGAYTQSAADVLAMPHVELMKNSPMYAELVAGGMSGEQARVTVANRTGLMSAAIQAPIGAATGMLVSKFEGNPLASRGMREIVGNLGRETVEEGIQSGTGQVAQNYATQQIADKTKQLTEGVGEQVGLGALYGLASAGVVQAPNALVDVASKVAAPVAVAGMAAVAAAAGAVGSLGSAIGSRAGNVQEANKAASPVAEAKVAAAAQTLAEQAPAAAAEAKAAVEATPDLPPEVKTEVNSFIDKFNDLSTFTAPPSDAGFPPIVQSAMERSPTILDAIKNLAEAAKDPAATDQDVQLATVLVADLQDQVIGMLESNTKPLMSLPADHPALKFVDDFKTVLTSMTKTEGWAKGMALSTVLGDMARKKGLLKPVTVESLDTPEGQANVQAQIAVATVAPEKADLQGVTDMLMHSENGKLNLTDRQRKSLMVAKGILEAAKQFDAAVAAGDLTQTELVGIQVKTSEQGADVGKQSALEHARGVRTAYNAGDLDLAGARLTDFLKFAQHMQNKVGAWNANLSRREMDANGATHYLALSADADREWVESAVGVRIHPTRPRSVQLAQTVSAEANAVTQIANALSDAYPELSAGHVVEVPLDGRLVGKPADVVNEFAKGIRKVGDPAQQSSAPNATDKTTAATVQPVPEKQAVVSEDAPKETLVEAPKPKAVEPSAEPKKEVVAPAPAPVAAPAPAVKAAEVETTPVEESSGEADVFMPGDLKPGTPAYEAAAQEWVDSQARAIDPNKTNPRSVEAVVPGLVQTAKNFFYEAFLLPKEARSRMLGQAMPIETVRGAFTGDSSYRAVSGKAPKVKITNDIRRAYEATLENTEQMLEKVQSQLTEFLDKKPKVGLTNRERLLKGEGLTQWINGRAVNLVEQVGDTFVYNNELLQTAGLAATQWMLSSSTVGAELDAKSIASIFNIDEDLVGPALTTAMQGGISKLDVLSSLAQKIEQYWGFTSSNTAAQGHTQGIALAMAGELVRAMVANGDLTQTRTNVDQFGRILPAETATKDAHASVDTFTVNQIGAVQDDDTAAQRTQKKQLSDALFSFADAIENLVQIDPVETYYFGTDRPKVAASQMRNPLVKNTEQDRAAIEANQNTPHFMNDVMVDLYDHLGQENLKDFFGGGNFDPETTNVQHARTLEGKNVTTIGAYQALQELVAGIKGRADAEGVEPTELGVHYAYNMSRVGRLQMLGRYSPQASKLVREAILPTRATMDLTTPEGTAPFMLALAQAMGVKVHTMSHSDSTNKVLDLLTGQYLDAVGVFQDWLKDRKELSPVAVNLIKGSFGKSKMTPVAFHALTEYARFLNATPDERKTFTTSLYVEADGVTNGPVNAMMLLSAGAFTPQWLTNMAKGGLFFKEGKTMNDHRSGADAESDTVDMYETAKNHLSGLIAGLRKSYAKSPEVSEQMGHMYNLMDLFLDDFKQEANGDITMNRGVTKNPLTITLYGSGALGIAGNVVNAMFDNIYIRMTESIRASQADPSLSLAQSMFPDAVDPQATFDKFNAAFQALTEKVVGRDKAKQLYVMDADRTTNRGSFDFTTFAFSPVEFRNVQNNVRYLFVDSMTQAITNTVGAELIESIKTVRMATQMHSIMLQDAWDRALQAKLEEKAKDPTWKKGDFLSAAELAEVDKAIEPLQPVMTTGTQSFYIANDQRAQANTGDISQALNGSMAFPTMVSSPKDSGVKGVPSLVIGTGDGAAMQINSGMDASRTLPVFDGIHLPLDVLGERSVQMNEAIFKSWMGNPSRAVANAVNAALKNGNTTFDVNSKTHELLVKALYGPYVPASDVTAAELRGNMLEVQRQINEAALEIQARHNALAPYQMSVDQMASAAAPYQRQGKVLTGTSEERAMELNTAFATQYAKLKQAFDFRQAALSEATVPAPVHIEPTIEASVPLPANVTTELTAPTEQEVPSLALRSLGRKTKSGAQELSFTAIRSVLKKMTLSQEGKAVMTEILRALDVKDYKVVIGTAAEINRYGSDAQKRVPSIEDMQQQGVNGVTVFDDRTIYLVNPTEETLVHELIHASTFDLMQAYYDGSVTGPTAAVVTDAMKNLEALRDQFLGMEEAVAKTGDMALIKQYSRARDVVQGYLNQGNQAAALNEFIAWNLTNKKLIDLGKKTEATGLKAMVQSVLKAIKQLVWGRKAVKVELPAGDMFSNLQFNSAILINVQPKVADALASGALYHSAGFGNDPRLETLSDTFMKLVGRFVNESTSPLNEALRKTNVSDAALQAASLSLKVEAEGFPMTMQEQHTFHNITAALMTQARIDGNALDKAQELFLHVADKLSFTDFLPERSVDPLSETSIAQMQYRTVMGANGGKIDSSNRSTLLTTFMGLALTNDHFRSILSKMEVPRNKKREWNTIDGALTTVGVEAMQKLGDTMAGTSTSRDVTSAIDALTKRIAENVEARDTFIETMAMKANDMSWTANEKVIEGLTYLADATKATADKVIAGSKNKYVVGMAKASKLVAELASDEGANRVSESVIRMMNQGNGFKTFREFVGDLIGRTDSNANVYDMIKRVRAFVQQMRQSYRETVPTIIADKFSRALEDHEWNAMHAALGKTDLSSLLAQGMAMKDVLNMFDTSTRAAEISQVEAEIKKLDALNSTTLINKSKQLAEFMVTGKPGTNLLRNAVAVANLLNEKTVGSRTVTQPLVSAVDKLATLYALGEQTVDTNTAMAKLLREENAGVSFAMSYLTGQRVEEFRKGEQNNIAQLNNYKGYIPADQQAGVHLIVADDAEYAQLVERSYKRVADYTGSTIDGDKTKRGYYFAPVSGKAFFNQGIFQNVRSTMNGVDAGSGFTTNSFGAGRITDTAEVAAITRQLARERGNENLLPVFNKNGKTVAYERSVDPAQLARINADTHLGKMIGVWRGRQAEEEVGHQFNDVLVGELKKMYDASVVEKGYTATHQEFININDPKALAADPVLADSVRLLTQATRDQLESAFGSDEFYVRKDMLNDALGYRAATVGDAWTGNTRWSAKTQNEIKKVALTVFGNDAFRYLVNAEQILQNYVSDARVMIVVKSVVVPMTNLLANMYQMLSRGIPLAHIVRSMPKKLAEVDSYTKSKLEHTKLEAELLAVKGDVVAERKIKTRMRAIDDAHSRMSIWPLIAAGELSAISDAGISREQILLTEGKLHAFVESKISKLPAGLQTAGRYALVTKDTALFQGLQSAVEYGDFLAKAILFDDLTIRQKKSKEHALGRVTEEFVNYDRLPGRTRGYAEAMGLLWFFNFKIRSTKIALSMLRNNPVHSLMAGLSPAPEGVGTPLGDNILSKGLGGSLANSIGIGMGLRAPSMYPVAQLLF